MLVKKESLHNCADDNELSPYSSDPNLLIDILIEESQTITNWPKENDTKPYDSKPSLNIQTAVLVM